MASSEISTLENDEEILNKRNEKRKFALKGNLRYDAKFVII